ncbi:MAG: hypothetical protein HY738_06570 [Bacteroidia bacterium]|nr:hypothetical protein [Bacteroidia bacterium]
MKKFSKLWITLCFMAFIYYGKSQDFEVSPVIINSSVEPGESEVKIVKVTNHINVKTSYILKMSDIEIDENGTKRYVKPGSTIFSAVNIITVSPNLVELNPEESGEVSVTIAPPYNDFSSTCAAIIVEPVIEQTALSADKNFTAAIRIGGRIVIDIYHSPASAKAAKATLSDFREITKAGTEQREFEITVKNIENTFVRGKLYLIAANMETTVERDITSIPVNLLPAASRKYKFLLPSEIEPGHYTLSAILDYGNSDTLEGMNLEIEIK